MDVVALTQPDPTRRSIEDALIEALQWRGVTSVWLAVAWARRSGLDIVEDPIKRLQRRRAVKVRALIGVDQHGATPSKRWNKRWSSSVRRVSITTKLRSAPFTRSCTWLSIEHPYVMGELGNLTEGSTTNYELAAQLDLELDDDGDKGILRDFQQWFDSRWKQPEA